MTNSLHSTSSSLTRGKREEERGSECVGKEDDKKEKGEGMRNRVNVIVREKEDEGKLKHKYMF